MASTFALALEGSAAPITRTRSPEIWSASSLPRSTHTTISASPVSSSSREAIVARRSALLRALSNAEVGTMIDTGGRTAGDEAVRRRNGCRKAKAQVPTSQPSEANDSAPEAASMLSLSPRHMPARLLFDVTGLVAWYAFYRTPTGIQRVIERILLAPAIADDDRVIHVAGFPGLGDLVVIDRNAIHGLGDPRTKAASIRHLRRAYVEMMQKARLLESLRTLEPFAWRYFALTRLGLKLLQYPER